MTIAIAAEGQDINAQVSHHGARAPYYLFFDEKGNLLEVVSNPYSGAERGAGPKAAQFLVQQGAAIVVAAEFGEKFLTELEDAGRQLVQKQGVISDIIKDLTTA